MKLDDLKNGDIVIFKNGEHYMKVDGFLVGYESKGYMRCSSYTKNMKEKDRYNNGDFDIEKVLRCNKYRFNIMEYPNKYMIWSRDKKNIVDWSEVEVDTPILVKGHLNGNWHRRYFAKFENGKVYAWSDGATSWSCLDSTPWDIARLAEN